MMIFRMIIAIALVVNLSAERIAAQYYYGGGESRQLKIDSTIVIIQFVPTLSDNELP